MTDITSLLRTAISRSIGWNREAFDGVLRTVSGSLKGVMIDWDPEAGENWARILLGKEVVGLVSVRCPFVILLRGVARDILLKDVVTILAVDTTADRVFKVDREVLQQLTGREVSDNWNPEKCSIDEIWWATAT